MSETIAAALILFLPLMYAATNLRDIALSLRSLRGSSRDQINRILGITEPTR